MLNYKITPNPKAHQWQIVLSFSQNKPLPVEVVLPDWVPGSYLIRDFSRHIVQINAFCNGGQVGLVQQSKSRWLAEGQVGEWQICYTVYAFDLSVRGSFLSTERGFFDGACLFLSVKGYESQPHRVELLELPVGWQVATALPQIGEQVFQTASYGELIDCPVELGRIEFLDFEAAGIPHRIALSGLYRDFDRARLVGDIRKICEAELAMFPKPVPFAEYWFLLHVGDNIYGGLEHISSTALLADRNSLPPHGMAAANSDYTQLLGLFSHEYFHAWNVKSIKPEVFAPYDLSKENYTEQLWAFEGITSYYDDLLLARSGVIAPDAYVLLLAQAITRVQQTKGRLQQTLAESSFTAWNKFYKQDENSPNAIVSYYQKGALAALCLDLLIRQKSGGKQSLDNVMQQHYLDWCATRSGIPEKQWQVRCRQITGLDLEDFFQTALYSTEDLPLEECLASVGIELAWHALPRSHGGGVVTDTVEVSAAPDLGARFKQHADYAVLTHVLNGGSAENGALCPQDKIIAVNGYSCTDLAGQWSQYAVGERVRVHFFRSGVLHESVLTVQAAEAATALLRIVDKERLENWLFNR
ncbi:M61 family metallopeptidase [Neisseria animalis]|uniref:M61 family peptidase n=1 Tax=Neisseria animalis TaxID=492 RepID=A0A5P3MPN1_NEIAN|nr:PDZ domain-containing protein [Neisseria animalis]QEY23496.1 M61 family peptidase [Neisseria animalis]ROW33342.1 M61 family peptidase [Neisseria animalis]VEE09074.1 peptidase M61 [Neisseria animalis]